MKKILLISLFVCLAFSCEDEIYSPIPLAPVNLILKLETIDVELQKLNAPQVYTLKDRKGHTGSLERFGYGGIIVVNVGGNASGIDLYAYDAACPVEANLNILVVPDSSGIKAKCPSCGAEFYISSSAFPISGMKHPLKQYNIRKGNFRDEYIVTN